MKIVIIGSGKVGYNLAESLSKENNDIVIIDKSYQASRKAEENLDVMCIKGNGVSTSALLEAGVDKADLLIAVTSSDEINMVCCLTGKKLGAHRTVARIRDPEYAQELSLLKEELELDLVINPERAAADEIARSLNFSSAINVESFARGRVKMVEFKVTAGMPIVGKKLKDLTNSQSAPVLIGVAFRKGEVVIPGGSFAVQEDDILYVLGKPSSVYNFCKLSGKCPDRIKNIMILGGGRITYYLTKLLNDMDMKVKIIEIDKDRCLELSELLPNNLMINADGTDEEVLSSENISDMDVFIAATGIDEENLLASLMAKEHGVKKVIAKISRTGYVGLVKNLGIDNIISPKLITSNQILKYVRGDKLESLVRIVEGQAEVLEFIAGETSKLVNIPLKDLSLAGEAIIATIIRKKEVVIPRGTDVIKKGDRVVIITKNKNIADLDDLSVNVAGGIQNELLNGIKKLGDIINL